MKKKSGLTIVERAIVLVPEFKKVIRKMDQQGAAQDLVTLIAAPTGFNGTTEGKIPQLRPGRYWERYAPT